MNNAKTFEMLISTPSLIFYLTQIEEKASRQGFSIEKYVVIKIGAEFQTKTEFNWHIRSSNRGREIPRTLLGAGESNVDCDARNTR